MCDQVLPTAGGGRRAKCKQSDVIVQASDWLRETPSDWLLQNLPHVDAKTRKIMTMYRMHHPKADVERIYLAREKVEEI